MLNISIYSPYITLGQFLKYASIITNGGEAKFFLSEHEVVINNEVDNRRGRKLYPGDVVDIDGSQYLICSHEN